MDGVIKIVHHDKGWGFIRSRSNKDFFFHKKHLSSDTDITDLQEGDTVTFEDADGPKGPYAEDVSRA